MKDFKIIFIHGWTGSSKADWFPKISEELNRLGIDYVIPDFPGGEHPHAKEWLKMLHKIIDKTDKPTILVGHSLGTRAVLLYLEKYKPNIKNVFLVAAFSNDVKNAQRRNGVYADFFEHKIHIEEIKPLVSKFIIMHSKDDPSIPYQQAEEIAKDLNAKLVMYDNRGHFIDDPQDAFIVLKELRKELDF